MFSGSYEGNPAGRAPEALNMAYHHRMSPGDARYARIDFSKQSSFEAGSLLYYIATHEDALPEYPSGYEYGPSGGITYDVLTAVEWSFLPATFPAAIKRILTGLLICDPALRWDIHTAINELREVVIAQGMVRSV